MLRLDMNSCQYQCMHCKIEVCNGTKLPIIHCKWCERAPKWPPKLLYVHELKMFTSQKFRLYQKKIGWFSIKNSKWNDTITILCFTSNIENQNCILIITAQPWHNQILYLKEKAAYRGQQQLQPPTVVISKMSSNSD